MVLRVWGTGILLCALLFGADANITAPPRQERPAKKLWWSSLAVLGAASALDAGSSWGKLELNPLLRGPDGRFGARGVAIKAALVSGACVFEWLVLRHHPRSEKSFGLLNLGMAATLTAAAVHNSAW